ncbi:MAG: integrase [Verrucomicrobiales bacterium]|jgi:integrase
MAAPTTSKTWKRTGVPTLIRHANGFYYARIYRDGKETRESLKTKTKSVAVAKLQKLKTHAQQARPVSGDVDIKASFRRFLELQGGKVDRLTHRAKRTRDCYHECLTKIERTWDHLDEPIRKISEVQCEDWAIALRENLSANRFNICLSQMKQIFDLAVKDGIVFTNPAADLKRQPPKPKELSLPSKTQFQSIVSAMKNAGGRFSTYCAEMVEFLAYSGCRREESENVLWRDYDEARVQMNIRKTKNGLPRVIPVIDDLKRLLGEIRKERDATPEPNSPILNVKECYKSLSRACAEAGCANLTHHDLRHLFATTCIESGVDIPTVSRWLGHKDGGALAMRVYGHLRDEHSMTQAQKVFFS